jgi:acyl dehydratase
MGRMLIEGQPYHIENAQAYVNKPIGVSEWMRIDQGRIDEFARSTNDPNPLHIDAEWCRKHSPYGRPIAHGFLTLSLLSHFAYDANLQPDGVDYGINYGFERVRFMAPVAVGQHVRMRASLMECKPVGGGKWLFKARCTVEVQETDRVALSAVWGVLFVRIMPAQRAASA